jgi:hypothetical protein
MLVRAIVGFVRREWFLMIMIVAITLLVVLFEVL